MQTVISEEAIAIIGAISGFISYICLIILIIRQSKYNEKELEEFRKRLREEKLDEFTKGLWDEEYIKRKARGD